MKVLIAFVAVLYSHALFAGAFVFAGDSNGVNRITHPQGFSLSNNPQLNVTVCIDPTGSETTQLETSVRNIANTWNQLNTASPNLISGGSNNIPSGKIDWESVTLHEVGHCLGLSHPNLGSQSSNGVSGSDTDFTQSTQGADNSYDIGIAGAGTDGIKGSNDDQRDDDVNLHWFNKGINNPFVATLPYDSSNYSRDVNDLPNSHSYVANADRSVGSSLGFSNTEAVMQQGSFFDEDQRQLAIDDVATLSLGMSGIDVTANTADDYTVNVIYGGVASGGDCDINIKHDPTYSGLAVCSTGGQFLDSTHIVITTANIRIGASFDWFYNTVPNGNDLIFSNGFE